MKVSLLNTRNAIHAAECDLWLDYWALYRGGKEFRARVERFLTKNAAELDDLYRLRCKESHYRCYIGPIVDYFAACLFGSKLQRESQEKPRAEEFYENLDSNADGLGTNLDKLLRDQFVRAAVKGCAFFALDFPVPEGQPRDMSEWRSMGGDNLTLRTFEREQALDWMKSDGELEWITFKEEEIRREDWKTTARVRVQRWWVYTRESVFEYEYTRDADKQDERNAVAKLRRQIDHGLGRVPVVDLILPDGTWIADRLSSTQVEHFRIASAQNWSIRRNCYAMAIFKVKDKKSPPVMGPGYYYMCSPEEGVEYAAPPADIFTVTQTEIASLKDELYRIVNQMAQGVDNNAAAVGRSGDSKLADISAMRVVLTAYGLNVRESLEQLLNLIAAARKDNAKWRVSGLDQFQNIDGEALLEILSQVELNDIGSETYDAELRKRIAASTLPGISEEKMNTILSEIDASASERQELKDFKRKEAMSGDAGVDGGRGPSGSRVSGGAGNGGRGDSRGAAA